jgi:hypothetical protein
VPPPPVLPEPPPLQPATVVIPRTSAAAQQGRVAENFPALVSIPNRVRILSFVVIS